MPTYQNFRFSLLSLLICLNGLGPAAIRADGLDGFIESLMKERKIPGLSLAIIEDGKILRAQGYGFTDTSRQTVVATSTLFQAGSISKPVAALGALRLVEQGKLTLNEDVNSRLQTWKVPENQFTTHKKVTVAEILSHQAGLTVHGFPGYAVGEDRPTLVQVLNGEKPANTSPIRVDAEPGSLLRYSGGGFTVLQLLMVDVSGESFPSLMARNVLTPLGMTNSTYQQPLPDNLAQKTATGYYKDGKEVPGRWHVYPEMAAAGLWTTATDLAQFAIRVQRSFAGTSNPVISETMIRQMLTRQKESAGLGIFLEGEGKTLRFMHNGRDEGFDASLVAYAETGQGAAILINANDDTKALKRIVDYIARQYKWPDYR